MFFQVYVLHKWVKANCRQSGSHSRLDRIDLPQSITRTISIGYYQHTKRRGVLSELANKQRINRQLIRAVPPSHASTSSKVPERVCGVITVSVFVTEKTIWSCGVHT